MEEFERWAAPEVEPEREEEQERSLAPVAALLGLALAAQLLQFQIPSVRAFLVDRDILARMSWIGFTLIKQWVLFVLLLLVLRTRDERLESVGFPALDARRLTLALGLLGLFLGAALLHQPATGADWMVPVWTEERGLWVLLGLTAAVVEETFFRGFAIVWLYRWSRHLPLAVVFPAAVFAAGHAYLGWVNVAYAFLAALAFSAVFLWRRDLYWPMVVHFLLDVLELFA